MRYGLSYFAAPLGRVAVTPRPKARLLDDPALVQWLDQLRRGCRETDKTPARYQTALRNIDRAMFAFANRSEHGYDAKHLVNVLIALGNAERTLAGGLRFAQEKYIRPLQGLSVQWLDSADDETIEFRLAAALAGIAATKKREVGPLRLHLEEVEATKIVGWDPGNTSAVWSKQPLPANLAAVFRRRQMEAFRSGVTSVPIHSRRPARLDDVLAFLSGETDDEKLADLIWALTAINWRKVKWVKPERSSGSVTVEFGLPRLLVNPRFYSADYSDPKRPRWTIDKGEANAKHDPDAFHALASGDINHAITKAARRLRSGGLTVNGYRNRQRAGRELTVQTAIDPERLLAAMLIPISNRDLVRIANTVLYPPEPQE
jgi:CRISPR-associated protein Csx17